MKDVLVVGSINQDFVVQVDRRPDPGETVTDGNLRLFPGGKGANQAVASVAGGAPTHFIGAVGSDVNGYWLREALSHRGVDVTHVVQIADVATGSAFISVTPDGENAIIVALGANAHLSPSHIEAAAGLFEEAGAVVIQLEIEDQTIRRVAELAKNKSVPLVLNAAPYRELDPTILSSTEVLILNEIEASAMMDLEIFDLENAKYAAYELLKRGPKNVVITLGENGAVAARSPHGVIHIDAPDVTVVDTTGAGDAFVGAFAASLANGESLDQCVRRAVRVASASVSTAGAQVAQ